MQGNSKEVTNCESLKCDACELGKGHRRPNKVNTTKNNTTKDQEINSDHIMPGQMVSADHYISRAPGMIYHTKGKSDPYDMLSRGCVFIDHASGRAYLDPTRYNYLQTPYFQEEDYPY